MEIETTYVQSIVSLKTVNTSTKTMFYCDIKKKDTWSWNIKLLHDNDKFFYSFSTWLSCMD